MNLKTIIYIILLILAFTIGYLINNLNLTGFAVKNTTPDQTLTRAFCNQKNECIDLKISCKDSKVIKIELLSDLKQFSQDWKDPRSIETLNNLCP